MDLFGNTEINITTEGKRHLGAALGSRLFVEQYMHDKVMEWRSSILILLKLAAYSTLTHRLMRKWTYFLCTIPNIAHLVQPLEDSINFHLILALTGRDHTSETERDLFALPTCLGGLVIAKPTCAAHCAFAASEKVTAPIVACILAKQQEIKHMCDQMTIKADVRILDNNNILRLL